MGLRPMKQSLDHLPELNRRQIHLVANTIRNEVDESVKQRAGKKTPFKIHKIILFGSYARQPDEQGRTPWVNDPQNGYISDYDILVIVNHRDFVEDHRLWFLLDDKIQRLIPDIPVGVLVHTLAEVNDWLNQGLYFFKDIREQGIELFSDSTRELARPGNLTDEEKRSISQKHFDIWFKKAQDNILVYDFVYQNPELDEAKAAFELHQATESLLSCTLLTCTNYLPKLHDPINLKSFCVQQDKRFADLFPMDTKFHRRSFQRLKRAYVEGRYSDHYEITKEELSYLAGEVEKLKVLVEKVCLAKLS